MGLGIGVVDCRVGFEGFRVPGVRGVEGGDRFGSA